MKAKQTGFTLIELMITVAIIGIMASVGYPSYTKHIQKAKRSAAQAALVSMATAMEQWRIENNSDYTGVETYSCGVTNAKGIYVNQVPSDCNGTKTYDLSISTLATGNYTLTAAPVSPQTDDDCGTLTLTSTGVKGASKAGAVVSNCWE